MVNKTFHLCHVAPGESWNGVDWNGVDSHLLFLRLFRPSFTSYRLLVRVPPEVPDVTGWPIKKTNLIVTRNSFNQRFKHPKFHSKTKKPFSLSPPSSVLLPLSSLVVASDLPPSHSLDVRHTYILNKLFHYFHKNELIICYILCYKYAIISSLSSLFISA